MDSEIGEMVVVVVDACRGWGERWQTLLRNMDNVPSSPNG